MIWATKQYYIGPVEGVHASNVHLLDTASVLVGGQGDGPFWRFTDTGIEFDAVVTGATAAAAAANVTAISVMLQRASRARGAYGLGTAIVLSVQLADDTWRYLDVIGGTISPVRDYNGGRLVQVTLSLTTLPYARGDAVMVGPNLLASASDMDAASWTRTNLTATANVRTDPFGATTAETIRETAVTGSHDLTQSVTKAAAAIQYTLSVYAQADGRNVLQLYLSDNGGANGAFGAYDLTAGTLYFAAGTAGTGWSGVSATIAAAGGGWYRCTLTATSNTATTIKTWLQLHNGSTTSYLGVITNGLLLWGAQLEAAASAGPLLSLTNGTGAVLSVLNIPGDVPALLRVTASDVSTGTAVMNRLRLVTRAMPEMVPGTDVALISDLTASESGDATAEANTIGGTYSLLNPTAEWETVGTVAKPAAQYSLGLMDVYARVRDGYSGLSAPALVTATATASGISGALIDRRLFASVTSVSNLALAGNAPPKIGATLTIRITFTTNITPVTPAGYTLLQSSARSYIYARIADGTETGITVTWAGSASGVVRFDVWYGLDFTATADKVATASSVSTSTHSSGTTAVLAQANELALTIHQTTNTLVGLTKAAAWTDDFDIDANGALIASQIVAATTALTHTATTASSVINATGIIATLRGRETAAENLAAATYQYVIVPFDALGNLGSSSNVVAVAVADGGASLLKWTAGGGAVTGYRIYWNRGAGWKYLTHARADNYYVHYTETGAITGDPPEASSVPGQWRALVSLASGTTLFSGAGVSSTIGDLAWHLVYLGTFPLPPLPALDDAALAAWRVTLQGKRIDGTTNAMGADALYFFPHDEAQFVAEYSGLALATKRDWVVETRRDGRTVGLLRTTGTSTDAGQLDVSGQAMIGPGDAAVMVHADRQGGVSDVVDSRFTLALRYVPRFRTIARGL